MSDATWAWDRHFTERVWSTEPDPLLVQLTQQLTPGTAIDLGCGPGRNAIWLATQDFRVTGVDASTIGLEQAAERAAAAGVSLNLVVADLLTYQVPRAAFDLAVVANLHPGTQALAQILAGAAEGLRVGGHLFVVGHHVDDLGRHGPPSADLLYTEDILRRVTPASLQVERLERVERIHSDGSEAPDSGVLLWASRAPEPADGSP